jgi:antitoxin HicB
MLRYTVVLVRGEEHGFTVLVPELPGCITEGDDVEQALGNARDAITVHLAGLAADGEAIPEEHEAPILAQVEVSSPLARTSTSGG